jgi:hypothetical protein
MDRQNGVSRIVGLKEKGAEFSLFETFFEVADGLLELGLDALAFRGQLAQDFDFFLLFLQADEKADVAFEFLFLLLESLRLLLVLPRLRFGQVGVYRLDFVFLAGEVKENPEALRASGAAP